MAKSFPCLVCGKELDRVSDEYEAQPLDGVMCRTRGNYGSRVFDSLSGEAIDFNICDDCFVEAGAKNRLFITQTEKPIRVKDTQIGWEHIERPYIPWRAGDERATDVMNIDEDELDSISHSSRVEFFGTIEDLKESIKRW